MNKIRYILLFVLVILGLGFVTIVVSPPLNPSSFLPGSFITVHQIGGTTKSVLLDSLIANEVFEYQIDEITTRSAVFLDTINPLTSEAKVWGDANIPIKRRRNGALISYSLTANSRDYIWKYFIDSQDSTVLNFVLLEKKKRVGSTIFVSKKYGSLASGIREYANFQFREPWSATQLSVTGDLLEFNGAETYTIGAVSSGSTYEYLTTSEVSLLRTGVNSLKIVGNNSTISSVLADPIFFNITTSGKTVEVNNLNFNKCSFKNCVLTGSSIVFNNCNFNTTDTSAIKFVNTLSDTTGYVVFKNCIFKSTHTAASPIYYSQSSTVRIFFYDCKFIGKATVSEIISNGTVAANKLFIDDGCSTNSITTNGSVTYTGGTLLRNAGFKL